VGNHGKQQFYTQCKLYFSPNSLKTLKRETLKNNPFHQKIAGKTNQTINKPTHMPFLIKTA
jgi:hypothetical protein